MNVYIETNCYIWIIFYSSYILILQATLHAGNLQPIFSAKFQYKIHGQTKGINVSICSNGYMTRLLNEILFFFLPFSFPYGVFSTTKRGKITKLVCQGSRLASSTCPSIDFKAQLLDGRFGRVGRPPAPS